jgi:hypothetical protein
MKVLLARKALHERGAVRPKHKFTLGKEGDLVKRTTVQPFSDGVPRPGAGLF